MSVRLVPRIILGAWLAGAVASSYAESFRFAWPVPGEVQVTAHAEKRGNESTVTYAVRLSAQEDGELRARFDGFRFLSLNGVDATDPALAARLGPMAEITNTLPTMRLAASGDYLGTVGLDAVLERLLAAMEGQVDEATRARLRSQFSTPQMRALMQQKSGEIWNVWVGAWNGLDISPGEQVQASVPIDVLGRPLEQKMVVEHLGPAPRHACCAHLRLTTLVEGPDVVRLVAGLIDGLAPPGQPVDPDAFAFARSSSVVEIVTEPDTLRPRWASVLREVLIKAVDGERHERVDRQSFTFEWP